MTQFVQDFLGLWVDGVAGLDFEVSVSLGVAGLGLAGRIGIGRYSRVV